MNNRQQSIGLSYKFFQEEQQNSKRFPVFPGVVDIPFCNNSRTMQGNCYSSTIRKHQLLKLSSSVTVRQPSMSAAHRGLLFVVALFFRQLSRLLQLDLQQWRRGCGRHGRSTDNTDQYWMQNMHVRHLLAYNGHTMKKLGSCMEKEIMQGTMPGACRRGRPHTAWMHSRSKETSIL